MDPASTGALIGGGIAVATTVANLAYNWWHSHSARQFELRQKVYLEACEWAARGAEYLVSFARFDLDDDQLGELLRPTGAAYYKIHVVAGPQTVQAFNSASEYLAERSMRLMADRVVLRERASQLQTLQSDTEQTNTYLQQLTTLIENLPKTAPTPETLAAVPHLVAEFTAARDRLSQGHAQMASLQGEILKGQESLLIACLEAAVGYGDHLAAANVAARRELGLPLKEREYREALRASSEKMLRELQNMIDRFKQA